MDDFDSLPLDQLRGMQQQLLAKKEAAQEETPLPSDEQIGAMDLGQLRQVQQQLQQRKLAPYLQDAVQAEAKAERTAPWSRERMMEPGIQHSFLMRKAFSISQPIHDYQFGQATSKFNRGEEDEDDLRLIAKRQLQDYLDAKRTGREKLAGGVVAIPGQVAEIMAGGRLASGVGAFATEAAGGAAAAAEIPAAVRFAGSTAAQAALTPNLGPANVIQKNLEAGRDPLDVRGVPPGMAKAMAEAAVLHGAGKVWSKVIPTSTTAGGYAVAGLTGPISQQITDLTTYTLGLNSRYGRLQDIAEGKYGEAASSALLESLTFAAMHSMHGEDAKPQIDRYVKAMNLLEGRKYEITDAAKLLGTSLTELRDMPLPEDVKDAVWEYRRLGPDRQLKGRPPETPRDVANRLEAEHYGNIDRVTAAERAFDAAEAEVGRGFARKDLPRLRKERADARKALKESTGRVDDARQAAAEWDAQQVKAAKPAVAEPAQEGPQDRISQPITPERPTAPETAPPAAPAEPAAEPAQERVFHIADYKRPGNSADAALAMLEMKGKGPRPLETWDSATGGEAGLHANMNAQGHVAFEFDPKSFTGNVVRGEKQGRVTSTDPLRYNPGLKKIIYRGREGDPKYAELQKTVAEMNKERADPALMKEYGREPMDPVKVELLGRKPGEPEWTGEERRKVQPESEQLRKFAEPPPPEAALPKSDNDLRQEIETHASQIDAAALFERVATSTELTPLQKHVLTERLKGRSIRDISKDPVLAHLKGDRAAAYQERKALEKIAPGVKSVEDLHAQEKGGRLARLEEAGKGMGREEVEAGAGVVDPASLNREQVVDELIDSHAEEQRLLKEITDDYERLPESDPRRQAPVRREIESALQRAAEDAEAARAGPGTPPGPAAPAAGPAPAAGVGPEPAAPPPAAAGGGAARGDQLKPAWKVPQRRLYRNLVSDLPGASEADLHTQADDVIARDKSTLADRLEKYTDAVDALAKHGFKITGRREAKELNDEWPGQDKVAESLGMSENELRQMVLAGKPKPITMKEAYHEAALQIATALEQRAAAEARQAGFAAKATAEARALGEGEGKAEGQAISDEELASESGGIGDAAEDEFGDIGFDPANFFVKPGGRPPRPPRPPAPPPGPQPAPRVDPADMLPVAKGALRELGAEKQRKADIAATRLSKGRELFDDMIRQAKGSRAVLQNQFLEWTSPGEQGTVASMPAGPLKAAAEATRELIDQREPELRRLGILNTFIDNYLGHIWKDPANPTATPEEIAARINSRRTLAGGESFRKQRSIPTFEDGFAAGLEPATWNPIEMQLLKLREMDKSIFGRKAFQENKADGILKFFRLGERTPKDWLPLPDKLGRVLAPGETAVKEYFDKQQMEGLEKFAASLGIDVKTAMKGPLGEESAAGIVRRFGTPEEVLAHEIGHGLDRQYNLSQQWATNATLRPELERLADLRASGRVNSEYAAYIKQPGEMVANLVAGYLHAPELVKAQAPHAYAALDSFLAGQAETRPMRDIKPSLELGEREQMMRVAGPMLTGHYYGPKDVINMYSDYLSPGLAGREGPVGAAYRAARLGTNTMNLFNLGFSGWHAMGTALNAQFSSMALGFKQLSRGEFGAGAKSLARGVVPGWALVKNLLEGTRAQREWYTPGSQGADYADAVKQVVQGGGRAGMDSFYRTSHIEAFRNAMKDVQAGDVSRLGSVAARAIPALAEWVNKPVMEYWVPALKFGAAMEAMRAEAESMNRRGIAMDKDAVRERFGKIWDSIDNRFGQLVYDNLFWNRTFKDIALASVRSVGWNVGTWREVGGAVRDIPSSLRGIRSGEGISDRVAYALALTAGTALMGAVTQYLMTGKGPEETKDLFYPKTGGRTKTGEPARLSFPTYMHHDILPLFNRADEGPFRLLGNAWKAAKGKLSPALSTTADTLENEDFHGAAIRDPNDSWVKQAQAVFDHIFGAMKPYSVQSVQQSRRQGAPLGQQAAGLMGVTPAPANVTKSWQQQRAEEKRRAVIMSPLWKLRHQR